MPLAKFSEKPEEEILIRYAKMFGIEVGDIDSYNPPTGNFKFGWIGRGYPFVYLEGWHVR